MELLKSVWVDSSVSLLMGTVTIIQPISFEDDDDVGGSWTSWD
jgi:hypothetical protein